MSRWYALTIVFCGLGALSGALAPVASADSCPNAAFRNGPSANLPDCRAYEMVSPVEKNGGYINEGSFTSSPEGESIGFTSISAFAGATSSVFTETGYQSSRQASGWSTTATTASEAQFFRRGNIVSTDAYDDLSFGNVEYRFPGAEGGVRSSLLQEVSQPESDLSFYSIGLPGHGGSYVDVGPAVPPSASNIVMVTNGSAAGPKQSMKLLGMSADGLHLVFTNPEPAGPNQWAFGGPGALLEYTGTGNSEPLPVGVEDGHLVNGCPIQRLGGVEEGNATGVSKFNGLANPISSDGKAIFFTEACREELFARIDNGEADQHTVAISEPTSADCRECDVEAAVQTPAQFLGASEDGSKAFFLTSQPLLKGTGGIYEYDFNAPAGEKIMLVAGADNAIPLQVSQDGSHVYFLSESVLTEEPSPDVRGEGEGGDPVEANAMAQPRGYNMYVYERDARYPGGHVSFVATLAENDLLGGGDSEFKAQEFESNVTPDGRFLVFVSHAELTLGDTSTASQVFEYDSETGNMTRVSIGEHGYNDNGNTYLKYPGSSYEETSLGGGALDEEFNNPNDVGIARAYVEEKAFSPSAFVDELSVSASGGVVFFQSPDGLTPQALNRTVVNPEAAAPGSSQEEVNFAQNVYEYREGNVYLISGGQDVTTHLGRSQVHLLSTDLSGRDVFFETTDTLVDQDTDTNKDIYDARIDGGFPAPTAPVSCEGDSCQGQLSSSPVLLSPGSEFQSGGNPAPTVSSSAPKPTAKKIKPEKKKKPKKKREAKKTKGKKSSSPRRGARVSGKVGRSS